MEVCYAWYWRSCTLYGKNENFDKAGQAHILHGSYSVIYVSGCLLRPILDAKEWMNEMRKSSRLFIKWLDKVKILWYNISTITKVFWKEICYEL